MHRLTVYPPEPFPWTPVVTGVVTTLILVGAQGETRPGTTTDTSDTRV